MSREFVIHIQYSTKSKGDKNIKNKITEQYGQNDKVVGYKWPACAVVHAGYKCLCLLCGF